ncbi:hypothetical protein B0T17DRAFT_591878 [Bombardia bombarda]|uniref:Yeast cell wall synthesis Kre9/Knh1-like N-terminal domain-containing protein n=1 Tax=Bombardia bombarda TaxID=252184 RepID=A0AA39WM43_9PEZI|nr:hypothetical protein B0T17DRAFT_591878 [Bombardia bombarda]
MKFTIPAFLALVASVLAEDPTPGFDAIQKPTEGEKVPAGKTYKIQWESSVNVTGPVTVSLLGGVSPSKLFILDAIKKGVDNSAGELDWDVPKELGALATYGIKISLDADPHIFQYGFPFQITGGATASGSGSGSGSASASAPSTSGTATGSGSSSGAVTTGTGSSSSGTGSGSTPSVSEPASDSGPSGNVDVQTSVPATPEPTTAATSTTLSVVTTSAATSTTGAGAVTTTSSSSSTTSTSGASAGNVAAGGLSLFGGLVAAMLFL